jgi:hypothetical protein
MQSSQSRQSSARPLQSLSDDQLLRRLGEITRESRRVEADLVAHIAEVDERRLFTREACSSMFAYCVEVLHLSEPETNLRIVVARASRRHPVLLDMLRDSRLHLSGVALLAPHLTAENRDEVLRRASHQSKRRIEELVAELAPRPDVPALVRKLPERASRPDEVNRPLGAPTPPLPPDGHVGVGSTRTDSPARRSQTIEPLAPARYKVQFTASTTLREKLERLQALMRRSVPDGDLAAIIEDAVTEKIARLEARRLAAARSPRKSVTESDTSAGPRHVPAAVKRAVRERDGDRCAYVDAQGRRCNGCERLEFHHRHPHALGGDRSPGNIALMCRAHNAHEAAADVGRRVHGPTSGPLIGPAAPP